MDPAKDLFFRYDGSPFFMSRDGFDREYAQYNIPQSTEKAWLEELTAQKLAALGEAGNWCVVQFLIHHGNFTRLPDLLAASPQGKLWEKTVFLETLLKYLSECRKRNLFDGQVEEGYIAVGAFAESLLRRARSSEAKARIQAVTDAANSGIGR